MNQELKDKVVKMEVEVLSSNKKIKGDKLNARLRPEIWKMIYAHMDRFNYNKTEAVEDLLIDGFNFNAGET